MVMPATTESLFSLIPIGNLEDTNSKTETNSEKVEKTPILEIVEKKAKFFKHELPPNAERKQALGSLMVDALVATHFDEELSLDEKADRSKKIQAMVKEYFPNKEKEEWEIARSGFLAESAFAIAMKESGFDVYAPSAEDDLKGKVDMWLDAKDGTVLAIQLKSASSVEQPIVAPLSLDENDNLPKTVPSEYAEVCKVMVKYAAEQADQVPEEADIIPLLIVVPGGLNTETSSFNMITGSPSQFVTYTTEDGEKTEGPLADAILEQFYKTIWKE